MPERKHLQHETLRKTDGHAVDQFVWLGQRKPEKKVNESCQKGGGRKYNKYMLSFDRMYEDVYIKNFLGSGGEVRTAFHETRLAITACGPE